MNEIEIFGLRYQKAKNTYIVFRERRGENNNYRPLEWDMAPDQGGTTKGTESEAGSRFEYFRFSVKLG